VCSLVATVRFIQVVGQAPLPTRLSRLFGYCLSCIERANALLNIVSIVLIGFTIFIERLAYRATQQSRGFHWATFEASMSIQGG